MVFSEGDVDVFLGCDFFFVGPFLGVINRDVDGISETLGDNIFSSVGSILELIGYGESSVEHVQVFTYFWTVLDILVTVTVATF